MTKYIIIADGSVIRASELTNADKETADNGESNIIYINDDPPKIYENGEWHGFTYRELNEREQNKVIDPVKKQQQRIMEAIEYLQDYMSTYDQQIGYMRYSDETVIDDILYGLGVALYGDQYKFGDGYNVLSMKFSCHIFKQSKNKKVRVKHRKR